MASWLKPSELRALAESRWGHRGDWRCVYCGRSAPDGAVDHFVPRERGGTDLPWNLVPSCPVCNRSKGALDPHEWMREVGVTAVTVAALAEVTRSPEWTRAGSTYRWPRLVNLRYRAADGLSSAVPPLMLPANLAEVFVLDPDAWAPATALRRLAADYLADRGRPPLSTQQLNRDLERRGLSRTTRKGVRGYRGIYVVPELAAAGRLAVGPGAAAAARRAERQALERYTPWDTTSGTGYSAWHVPPARKG